MIIKKLVLDNVGLYGESTSFSLMPNRNQDQSIILIGGKNGAGKTTFLESVRLALYGKRALGLVTSQKKYEEYLESRINRNNKKSSASIELTFIYTEANQPAEYTIQRSWYINNHILTEKLNLTKNGEQVTSVPKEEWSNFLLELVPIGVSQLFFFDGERIQDMAEDNNSALSEAVKTLLGIDLIEKLKFDLNTHLNQSKLSKKKIIDQESINKTISKLKKDREFLLHEVKSLNFQKEGLLNDLEQKKQRFISEGGNVALKYDQLKAKLSTINKEITACRQELVSLANGLLPFLMAPKLMQKFKLELKQSIEHSQTTYSPEYILEQLNLFKMSALPKQGKWDQSHWSDLEIFFSKQLNYTNPPTNSIFSELDDPISTLSNLDLLDTETKIHASNLSKKFNELNLSKEATEFSISRAESVSDKNSYLDELLLQERKLGEINALLAHKDNELNKVEYEITSTNLKLERAVSENASITQQSIKDTLAAKSIKVLIDFQLKLFAKKILEVKKNFIDIFNSLLRKNNYITDIEIDPKTFATKLMSEKGKEISKQSLSAGEKQIYAIAILWALAKTSGRNLPMIIDTPLGRLDREHRDNLMKYYFPHVSHQVIILSTDTEIDEQYVHQLKNNISEVYLLDYNESKGFTEVKTQYFELNHRSTQEKKIALHQA
ncbi:DNA sulfur modification protein DndD [Acinetobacter guillouiae MSP4-18]|uniref:DNA sulfur modification protein DndD n=1 Tax=Acinetobacter guillouiae TaxID=106649 RepID=UPI0002CEC9A3|nr:DNA sulfur modification protein DndD [Acinetobacter guillouiae]ENU60074.1 DNA sulfur modification protein DndD [Acinetobacter guillouiae CIP 63.46]EPH38568.1 DNA sulfur modification protein DndD [Acinetobacter guillouiae MSP4-18]KAB0629474.1 DNA sulfur modification protein DndD [Acinetobacter guillouiae]